MSEAKDFIRSAEAIGCKPQLDGEWIKWQPPLPAEMLKDAVRLSDKIAAELGDEATGQN
ncbi:MAG: hypothetical protein ACJA1I_000557 [Zhongshania marina]|jgi:hypothetical protein